MDKSNKIKFGLLLLCLATYVIIAYLIPNSNPSVSPDELKELHKQGKVMLTPQGQLILALMAATILAWIFEVVPIGMASVFALFMMPTIGLVKTPFAMQNFAIPTIFFILSSFCFARGFIKTGLGYRISLMVSTLFGKSSGRVLLSFMMATGVISMFLADIPTAIVFGSIAFPILQRNNCEPGKSKFGMAMMMGIPMAAAIGGIGTPAGSGLNVLALDLLKSTSNVDVNFAQWAALGIPTALVLIFLTWVVLMKMVTPEIDHVAGLDDIKSERAKLGPLNKDELKFCLIFSITLVLWFTSVWTKIPIYVTAVSMATLLFVPGINVIEWKETSKGIGWEVLLLVGASNAMAKVMMLHGADKWIASFIDITGLSVFVMILAVVAFGVFSHLILPVGNVALAVCIPVIAVLAQSAGVNPALLIIPLGFCASCVFLIPVDPIPLTTYQYGYWRMIDMMKPGWVAAVIWVLVLTVFAFIANMIGVF